MVASETQTDSPKATQPEPTATQPRHQLRMPQSSNLYAATASTSYTTSQPDLLDATKRYFEEYDRRLRNATDAFAHRRHLQFQDAQSAQEMEWKQEQVRRELERRKQKVASMIDLRALQQRQNYTSIGGDQAAQQQRLTGRYGSLPRRGVQDQYSSSSYTRRPNYYGSLPRNFESNMLNDYYDGTNYPLTTNYQPLNQYSRSTLGLDRPSYQQQLFDENLTSQRRPLSFDDLSTRQYTNEYGPKQADDMLLSQYASYVNNQINAAGFLDDPYEVQKYELTPDYTPTQPPLQDLTTFDRQQYMPSYVQSQPVTPFMQDIADPLPRQQQMTYDPLKSGDYVYSRREQNYGSRPAQPVGNYGNYNYPHRNVRAAADSLMYPEYNKSRYWNTMPTSLYGQELYGGQGLYGQTSQGLYSGQGSQGLYGQGSQNLYGDQANQGLYSGQRSQNLYGSQGSQNLYSQGSQGLYSGQQNYPSEAIPPSSYAPQRYLNNNFEERWPSGYAAAASTLKPYSCSTQPRPQPQPYGQASMFPATTRGRLMRSAPQSSRWNA